jgi:predicted dehydrogenase
MYRHNPAIQFCQRAVREGWLGQIFEVHAVMSRQQPLAYRQWLAQFRGGTMYIFGCHLIDLVVSMLGKPDRTEIDYHTGGHCVHGQLPFEYLEKHLNWKAKPKSRMTGQRRRLNPVGVSARRAGTPRLPDQAGSA